MFSHTSPYKSHIGSRVSNWWVLCPRPTGRHRTVSAETLSRRWLVNLRWLTGRYGRIAYLFAQHGRYDIVDRAARTLAWPSDTTLHLEHLIELHIWKDPRECRCRIRNIIYMILLLLIILIPIVNTYLTSRFKLMWRIRWFIPKCYWTRKVMCTATSVRLFTNEEQVSYK